MGEVVIQSNGVPVALEVYERVLPNPKQSTVQAIECWQVFVPACFASWVLVRLNNLAGELGRSFWDSAVFMAIYGEFWIHPGI